MLPRVLPRLALPRLALPRLALPLLALPLLAACHQGPLSALDPAGPASADVAAVWWAMLWGATAVFCLTVALALYAALKRPSAAKRAPVGALLVGGGLILPGVVILALLAYGVRAGYAMMPRDASAFRVEVTAQQWRWTAQYPDGELIGGTTDNRIVIPAGRPIHLTVKSIDVIHSFWVPRLGGKIDAIPGHENTIRLQADRPGIYRGLCAEFCGERHAHMFMEVEALDETAFAARFKQVTP
ncbi:cytochrome c oxidase subunit II [Pigmentiphaga aceris]|uniref:cytochrome c oxidase subunit II n=1 Tax=Pigmentiphaga aceris TaxID=1940612 RepID=UPI001CA319F7|nr:cytochrome c oxidase subunit II [Pigmentiphaga aceris]